MGAPPYVALVVIDLQRGFDDPVWGKRNNPACETNVADLVATFRAAKLPVVYVQHSSVNPDSPLAPGGPGHALENVLPPVSDLLVEKSVHSAFHGKPDLHAWLTAKRVAAVAIAGVQTNHCCETTARIASDLGYDVWFVLDATYTFARRSPEGRLVSADELVEITATNLDGEFAEVMSTRTAIQNVRGRSQTSAGAPRRSQS